MNSLIPYSSRRSKLRGIKPEEIKQSTLSSYKSARRFPRADEAVAIAEVLETTVEYLVTGENSPISLASRIARRPKLFAMLSRLEPCPDIDLARVSLGLDAILGPETIELAVPAVATAEQKKSPSKNPRPQAKTPRDIAADHYAREAGGKDKKGQK